MSAKELGMIKKLDSGWIMNIKHLTSNVYHWILVMIAMLGLTMSAHAGEVTGVTLLDSDSGDRVRIEGSEPLTYEIFDLDGPPRLVLNFAGSTVANNVAVVKAEGDGVNGIVPINDGGSSRIEIALSAVQTYTIKEEGNAILIQFDAAVTKSGSENAAVVQDIEVRDRGSVTELVLRGEHMNANHNAFMAQNNKQLILDFWGGKSLLKKEVFKYSSQIVSGVQVGQADGRVRFVVNLIPVSGMHQQIDAEAGEMVVRLGGAVASKKTDKMMVENIEFRPDDRIAHVMIQTSETNPVVNVQQKDDHITINLKNAHLLAGQERSQDVEAFPGPIRQIDSYQNNNNVRIVARLREAVSVTSFQQGNVFTLNFEPEDLARAREGSGGQDKFTYTGQKVTFDFKDIDIRNALKLIAEMSDLNIIMSDNVSGNLTMRLVDVPWDQALELILSSRGLGKETEGNVMRVAPMQVLRAEYETKIEARKGSQQLEPLLTEFITLNFTKVDDIKKILEGASANATKGGASGTNTGTATTTSGNGKAETSVGILSPRGSYLIDVRTNTLILKDTEEAINSVKRLIAKIDTPIKQVLIEARIVEATDNFLRDVGVRWGGNFTSNTGNKFPSTVGITGAATGTNLIDLPAAVGAGSGGAVGLALGSVSGLINLNLELSAAELDKQVKIISNPRIVTANLKPALISQGVSVPFITPGATAGGAATTQFIDAVLSLKVTPQITADNGIIMDIVITKDSPTIFNAATSIDKKEINTNIYMKNGETAVIGGIYTKEKSETEPGVPLLSKIPVLGWLFKKNTKIDNRSELLVFITPKIMDATGIGK